MVIFSSGTDAINHEKSCYLSFEIKRLNQYFILFPVKNKAQKLFATRYIIMD